MIYRKLMFSMAIALLGVSFVGIAHASPVPELDPSSAASGSALLIGGALFLVERYRRR